MEDLICICFVVLCAVMVGLFFMIAAEDAGAAVRCPAAEEMCNIRPVSAGLLDYAMTPSDAHWAARGYTIPCRARMYLYVDADDSISARGDQPGCRIYWNRSYLLDAMADIYDTDRQIAREGLEDLCQTAAHERGHNLGLGHTANHGLMDPDGGEWTVAVPNGSALGGIIPECKTWARRVVRQRHGRRIRKLGRMRLDSPVATP